MTPPILPDEQPENPTEEAPQTPQRRSIPLRELWSRLSLSNLQIILVLLTVIGGRLVIDFGQRIVDGQRKVAQQEALELEIQQLQYKQQQLEQDKAYYSSPTYVQVWAHSDGKMVLSGEKIVIPLYKGQPRPKRTPLPAPPPEPLAKWVTWWTLFFDGPPPASQSDSGASNP